MWFHLLPLLLFFLFQLWWAVVSAQLRAQHSSPTAGPGKGHIPATFGVQMKLREKSVPASHSPFLQGWVGWRDWRWWWQWQWGHRGWGQSRGSARPLAQLVSCPPPHKTGRCKLNPWSSGPRQQQAQPWGPRKHPEERQAQRKGHCKLPLIVVFPLLSLFPKTFYAWWKSAVRSIKGEFFSGKNPHFLSLPLNMEHTEHKQCKNLLTTALLQWDLDTSSLNGRTTSLSCFQMGLP